MTLFEYLAIAFSLVFSFAAMRLIAGLPFATRPGRRYWVHLVMVCGHLATTVAVFWALWSFHAATWTLARFALALANPALIFLNACTLIPEDSSAIESWRNYYYAVRQRYFIGVAAWALVLAGSATVLLRMPWSHPARLAQAWWLAFGLAGAVSSSERVHSALALSAIAIGLAIALTIIMQPGAIAP